MMQRLLVVVVMAGLGALAPVPADASFTCSTVARSGQVTPDGFVFGKRYDFTDVNSAGDVLFVTRPVANRDRLYLFPAVGAPSTVATATLPAPNGGTFGSIGRASINDGGALAFAAQTNLGETVFLRESGGSLEVAATKGGVSPGGGAFVEFPALSSINASAKVAFVADVTSGPSGVFLYDGVANTRSAVALVGDAAGGGRQFCEFESVGLGDSSAVAFRALAKVDCNDAGETPIDGVYFKKAGVVTTIALQGGTSPVPSTTYLDFEASPEVNALDHVGFRAELTGIGFIPAVLRFDPVSATTVKVAARGDAAPGGGTLGRIDSNHLVDADAEFVQGGLQASATRFAVLRFGPGAVPVLLGSDPPPLDAFAPGALYKRFARMRASNNGNRVVLIARVRDTVSPRGKVGVLRCNP